jgi:hypothetical protein
MYFPVIKAPLHPLPAAEVLFLIAAVLSAS